MNINTLGIDIAKNIFHLVGINEKGKKVFRKKLKRNQFLPFLGNQKTCKVGIEACASSHHWARELTKLGYNVKLLPPQHVKAYLRGNKNDYNDALAIAEARNNPEIRGVAIKTVEQQGIQALHRMRSLLVGERTALCNQIRGLLGEFGITIVQGISHVRKDLPLLIENKDQQLMGNFCAALALLYDKLVQLDEQITVLTEMIAKDGRQHQEIKRLRTIPGFGPLISSAFFCTIGDGKAFKNGRGVSASIGIVPKQYSSGDKTKLYGISKRGDKYLRKLLVLGAKSVIRHAAKKDDKLSRWVTKLVERRGINKATVALANKLARIAWAITTTQQIYKAEYYHG